MWFQRLQIPHINFGGTVEMLVQENYDPELLEDLMLDASEVEGFNHLRYSRIFPTTESERWTMRQRLIAGCAPGQNEAYIKRCASSGQAEEIFYHFHGGKSAFISWLRNQETTDNFGSRIPWNIKTNSEILSLVLGECIVEAVNNGHVALGEQILHQLTAWEPRIFETIISESQRLPCRDWWGNYGFDIISEILPQAPLDFLNTVLLNGHRVTLNSFRLLFNIYQRIDPTNPSQHAISRYSKPLRGDSLLILRLFLDRPEVNIHFIESMRSKPVVIYRGLIFPLTDYVKILKKYSGPTPLDLFLDTVTSQLRSVFNLNSLGVVSDIISYLHESTSTFEGIR